MATDSHSVSSTDDSVARLVDFFATRLLLKRYRPDQRLELEDEELPDAVSLCETEFTHLAERVVAAVAAGDALDALEWLDECADFSAQWMEVCHWVSPKKFREFLTEAIGATWAREEEIPAEREQPPRDLKWYKNPESRSWSKKNGGKPVEPVPYDGSLPPPPSRKASKKERKASHATTATTAKSEGGTELVSVPMSPKAPPPKAEVPRPAPVETNMGGHSSDDPHSPATTLLNMSPVSSLYGMGSGVVSPGGDRDMRVLSPLPAGTPRAAKMKRVLGTAAVIDSPPAATLGVRTVSLIVDADAPRSPTSMQPKRILSSPAMDSPTMTARSPTMMARGLGSLTSSDGTRRAVRAIHADVLSTILAESYKEEPSMDCSREGENSSDLVEATVSTPDAATILEDDGSEQASMLDTVYPLSLSTSMLRRSISDSTQARLAQFDTVLAQTLYPKALELAKTLVTTADEDVLQSLTDAAIQAADSAPLADITASLAHSSVTFTALVTQVMSQAIGQGVQQSCEITGLLSIYESKTRARNRGLLRFQAHLFARGVLPAAALLHSIRVSLQDPNADDLTNAFLAVTHTSVLSALSAPARAELRALFAAAVKAKYYPNYVKAMTTAFIGASA